jgi:hypothetical protein
MATTTNYGWTTPDDTALVKDGAAAIRTLGSSVDTTTKALNPSTTLGDIEYRSSTANTNTRLGIGSSGQVLSVSGGVPAWTTPSASALTLISATSITNGVSSMSLNNVFSSTYKNYRVIINWLEGSSTTATVSLRLRASGTDNSGATAYQPRGWKNTGGTLAGFGTAGSSIPLNVLTGARPVTVMDVLLPQTTDQTNFIIDSFEGFNNDAWGFGATHNVGAAYDGFTVFPSTGTFTGGTIYVYGYGA